MNSDEQAPFISVVMPALNEAHNLPRTLSSIAEQLRDYPHEVVLVDNGSTDGSPDLARAAGARVFIQPRGSIGALRNLGVGQARGEVIVFLDADVSLTPAWRGRLPAALADLAKGPPLITGSHCGPPEDGSWIERNWFRHFALESNSSHLGTGHMLIRREFFLAVGGFDETLVTGEDYEFCQRARAAGGRILNDPLLRVVHHDFPKDLRSFVRREAWHGRGDLRSWRSFLASKVAIAATIFLGCHLLILAGVLLPGAAWLAGAGAAGLVLLLLASAWKKYGHAPWRARLTNGLLYYFYYLGRVLSFRHVLPRRAARRTA